MRKKRLITLVGQIPPPLGGQAVIFKKILDGCNDDNDLVHINVNYSRTMSEMGVISFLKFWELIKAIYLTIRVRFNLGSRILYYAPSGSQKIPVYRDIIFLILCRYFYDVIIFQFFAGGLDDFYKNANVVEKFFFKIAFNKPDFVIVPTKINNTEGRLIHAIRDYVIPWSNSYVASFYEKKINKDSVHILFVGLLVESKGIFLLLKAINSLIREGVKDIIINILGSFKSVKIEKEITSFINDNNLQNFINIEGVKSNSEYYQYFADADIFCFPTYFEAENLPVVIIDALQFGLPIISSKWRGIPEAVIHEYNGYLVDIMNVGQIFYYLNALISDRNKRSEMGKNSKFLYYQKFSDENFISSMKNVFSLAKEQL